ncbi:MAG: hypothetical protein LBM08_09045 [Dysgonamonadaceae bacterium]|jgi:hypothetical protein|nr:hypothetical protein [Dysgonamonadaceae bacterium]
MKKKVLLGIICILGVFIVAAQAGDKTDRQGYVGHYVFPWENQDETIEIALQDDSTFTMFSSAGKIKLKYVEKDRFEFPQYGGVIVFERDEEQEIIACKISVAAINMKEVKALKQ